MDRSQFLSLSEYRAKINEILDALEAEHGSDIPVVAFEESCKRYTSREAINFGHDQIQECMLGDNEWSPETRDIYKSVILLGR